VYKCIFLENIIRRILEKKTLVEKYEYAESARINDILKTFATIKTKNTHFSRDYYLNDL